MVKERPLLSCQRLEPVNALIVSKKTYQQPDIPPTTSNQPRCQEDTLNAITHQQYPQHHRIP
jgi:hypothetical protein